MTAIETKGLTKLYKDIAAVDNINLKVPEGCICGFLGKNGAGKTTAIKMLAGLRKPTSGVITIMGQQQTFGRSSNFGYLPDVPGFYTYMNGEEYLLLCAKLRHMHGDAAKSRIRQLLASVGLLSVKTRIGGYSRGMKQRLGIAQALLSNPPVIFMDEPMSALDPMGRREVAAIISNLQGVTVMLSTHILADVQDICDYIVILEKGQVCAQDYLVNLMTEHAKNAAKIRFFNAGDADKFFARMLDHGAIFADRPSETELELGSAHLDRAAISTLTSRIMTEQNLACEYFSAEGITLEEIFYNVIGGEENA